MEGISEYGIVKFVVLNSIHELLGFCIDNEYFEGKVKMISHHEDRSAFAYHDVPTAGLVMINILERDVR